MSSSGTSLGNMLSLMRFASSFPSPPERGPGLECHPGQLERVDEFAPARGEPHPHGSFGLDERAVVPRSFIAELLRECLRPWLVREPKQVLDLCTGSGCLAVLLALTFVKARVDAADLSSKALEVAKINIRKYQLEKRVRAVRSDLFQSLDPKQYDLIVCNPPYVTARSTRKLPKEYRHEPAFALAAGKDGLDLVHRILAQAKDWLTPGGLLCCEIGGNRKALARAYPRVEFLWPQTSDPRAVFILERAQLLATPGARTAGGEGTPPMRARAQR